MKNLMRNFFTVLFLSLLSITMAIGQFPGFGYHTIGTTSELTGQTSLADIDNDGDLDWVVGSYDSVWWFEYQSADTWVKHILGLNPKTETGGTTHDIDGDGWIDHVSGPYWYKNPGNPKEAMFERIENKVITASEIIIGDVTGDGVENVIAMNDLEGIYWYDYSKNPEKKWKSKQISDNGVRTGISPHGIADINNSGLNDIIRSNVWYENLKEGKKWVVHPTIKLTRAQGKFPNSTRTWALDFDGDGDIDIVQVESFASNCRVVWHEKRDRRGLDYYMHTVDSETLQELQSLGVADFDGDGDYDIFAGGSTRGKDFKPKCYIWENVNGKGTEWKRHEILSEIESYGAAIGDVDGDGDIDICSKPWHGKENYFLENKLK